MCGRYAVTKSTYSSLPGLINVERTQPDSFNVAPSQMVEVVREQDDQRYQAEVKWGFVPVWAKDFKKQRPQPINAKIENVLTSGMWKKPFAAHRCIVPADGYYEWTVTEHGKQPHWIHNPNAGLAMAGLVGAWPDPDKAEDDPEKWRLSMAIITRDAHVAPGEVHDRMPACLTPDVYEDWLGDHLDSGELAKLLDQSSKAVAHDLTYYEVSKDVNSVRNNWPALLEPLGK